VFSVETRNIAGAVTAVGSAGPFTLVVDRPAEVGGGGKGFTGSQLLHLAVAAGVSNDLFRESAGLGIELDTVRVTVAGDFDGAPPVSGLITHHVEIGGRGPEDRLRELVELVDRIAEIPNSLRQGTPVELGEVRIVPR